MEGDLHLTDLRDPASDSVAGLHQRLVSSKLAYSPHIRSFVTATEDRLIHALPLRRFFKDITIARASAAVTGLATSRWHPNILVGTAGGEVFATNPLRRVLRGDKEAEPVYSQLWFQHEWVRKRQVAAMGPQPKSHGSDPPRGKSREGTSRFLEGFKAEKPSLHASSEGTQMETIYEEETGVTCLEWNPNVECAGWAAVGFGCGLIRVEDLAIE